MWYSDPFRMPQSCSKLLKTNPWHLVLFLELYQFGMFTTFPLETVIVSLLVSSVNIKFQENVNWIFTKREGWILYEREGTYVQPTEEETHSLLVTNNDSSKEIFFCFIRSCECLRENWKRRNGRFVRENSISTQTKKKWKIGSRRTIDKFPFPFGVYGRDRK
jgi:hypothetical protein